MSNIGKSVEKAALQSAYGGATMVSLGCGGGCFLSQVRTVQRGCILPFYPHIFVQAEGVHTMLRARLCFRPGDDLLGAGQGDTPGDHTRGLPPSCAGRRHLQQGKFDHGF
jgi:hypothetical protein